jgi:endoglucanase
MKKTIIQSAVLLAGLLFGSAGCSSNPGALTEKSFLKADGKDLRTGCGKGKSVKLHGTNAGGYLVQELWMTPTLKTVHVKDEMSIYTHLENRFGKDKAYELITAYQDAYWTTKDFDNVQALGANCIRLPFWYRNLVDENGVLYQNAFKRLDWFVSESKQRGIYVILDMHGAPGSQNGSDHSGVDGEQHKKDASGFFFGDSAPRNQEKYYELWKIIAAHYKGNPAVAGYDLLNEPFCTYRYNPGLSDEELHAQLWSVYDKAYTAIRAVDPDHIIIMEAVWNPADLPEPDTYGWKNIMYEYHNYMYEDYENAQGKQISSMEDKLRAIAGADFPVPTLLGEFCFFTNYSAWDTGLSLLNKAGVNWTTWTYKTTADCGNWGIYHHPLSAGKINLEHTSFDDIQNFWSTADTETPNTGLIKILKKYM